VDGALGQTGCAIELVVVDDGCTTPVAELLAEFDDPRLRVLRVPHGRVSRARNAGIEVARGDWVRFIDHDDVIVVDSTAHLLELAAGDAVVTYGATLVCDEELRPLSKISSSLQGDVVEACLLGRFDTTIHSLLYPRAVVEAVGPWESSIIVSQDWDYALRAFELTEVRGDARVATWYRTHESMNSRDVRRGIEGYELVLRRYFDRHPEQRGTRLERRAHATFHAFAAVQSARSLRDVRAALGHAARSLASDPREAVAAGRRHGAFPLKAPVGLERLGDD
jgi:glycosyltransferase involved in cell wall biosynthesis